jgi:TldD protein
MIDDIAGGFTFTGRGQPQAFQVQPLVVYKVYTDGRPDELVRGVDIVGTPLVSLTKILATGDTMDTFNGYCGAESGSVPVSASAPAILISEMEVQKKETSTDKPPILPPPGHDPKGVHQ